MGVLELLGKRIVFFDGAMGTILQQNGLGAGGLPELWNLERPDLIEQIHRDYLAAGADIVKHAEGSDPASVVFDAIAAAKARNCDVLICDTAGRLHNKKNLMDELAKMNRIIEREAPDSSKEVLLVLDATTGQNAVNQARLFKEVAPISGIVLTKLDGTAKGGIVISIKNELGIPVKLIGVGEKIDDLQPFNSRDFVRALFESTSQTVQTEEENENEQKRKYSKCMDYGGTFN